MAGFPPELDHELNREFHFPTIDAAREIRLVELTTASTAENIQLEFHKVPAHELEHLGYKALSYQWGGGECMDDLRQVAVDGKIFYVRLNLYDFLVAMQRSRPGDLVYIDAICIAQTDLQEKAQQVTLMSDIYKHAAEVLVWLGPLDAEKEQGLLSMSSILERRRAAYDAVYEHNTHMDEYAALERRPWTELEQDAFRFVCARPYWSRLWIVQEVLLARKLSIVSGNVVIPWKHFVGMTSGRRPHIPFNDPERFQDARIDGRPEFAPVDVDCLRGQDSILEWGPALRIVDAKKSWNFGNKTSMLFGQSIRNYGGLIPLHRAMALFGNQQCKDPRDKLYGLLGLIEGGKNIEVSYEASIESIYRKALQIGMMELSRKEWVVFNNAGEEQRQFRRQLAAMFGVDDHKIAAE